MTARTKSTKKRTERLPAARLWIVMVLCAAAVLAYAPALAAPFVMDDQTAIAESSTPHVQSPAGSPVAGRPVVSATLAVNHRINALLDVDQRPDPDGPHKAIGYRLFNIFVHLCTAALLFGVLRRSIRSPGIPEDWRAIADPLAAIVCALWLLHPIQTEAINYVVQRTELLASLCYVATLYASIRAWDAGEPRARRWWYATGATACVVGMLCKEIVISAPLAVVLYDRAFRFSSWREVRRPANGRAWYYLSLVAACVIPYAIFSAGARGDTAGFGTSVSSYAYLLSQCWAVPHYLWLAVWPHAFSIDYGTQPVGGAGRIAGLVLLGALALATVVAWTRAERWGWFAFLGSAFFMLLAPSSSVVPIGTEIAAERRIYLALAAVITVLAVGAEWLRRRAPGRLSARQLGFGACAVAVVLAGLTAARSSVYMHPAQLWRGAVSEGPGNLRAYVNLGEALVRERPPQYAAAETAFTHAITRDTTCHNGCSQLASMLSAQGRLAEAEPLLERTLQYDPLNGLVEERLARVLLRMGTFDRALPHLEHLAAAHPTQQVVVALAVAYFAVQRQRDAVTAFDRAAQLYPGNAEIRRLSGTLSVAARGADALRHLQELELSLTQDWQ